MRLAVTGGGTGGHVYPALSVVAGLQRPPFSVAAGDVLYLGLQGGPEERLAAEAGLAFSAINAAPVRGRNPLSVARGSLRIASGIVQASKALRQFGAQVVLATGGYVSVPVGIAAWLRRIPLLLYVPDLEPGLAVQFLARIARQVAVTAPLAVQHYPESKTVVTGYPVRPGFGSTQKAVARTRLNVDPVLPLLLVWGGSQGAHALNQHIADGLDELLGIAQVLHVSGANDANWLQERRAALAPGARERYHLYPYLATEMPDAMAAADLAISRSGASILGEFTTSGLPSILVPYPYAGAHQRWNANYLVNWNAAVLLEEANIDQLLPTVLVLLRDPSRLHDMSVAARSLAKPDAALSIAGLLAALAEQPAPASRRVGAG